MERYFYAPGTLFPYKEKILLQPQKEQNGKVFLRSWNIISLQGKDSPSGQKEPNGRCFHALGTLLHFTVKYTEC